MRSSCTARRGSSSTCAVFTNLTQDHLDFHGTLDAYYASKRRLFTPATGTARPARPSINVDDEWGAQARATRSAAPAARRWSRSACESDADFHATDVELRRGRRDLRVPRARRLRRGAAAAARAVQRLQRAGRDRRGSRARRRAACGAPQALASRAARARAASSRSTRARPSACWSTTRTRPDSLENVLSSARGLLDEGRLIVVFGAGGDRDRDKRPLMGAAARRLADHVVVTSDNPRSEDPDAIIAAIVAGAEAAPPPAESSAMEVEADRRTAIERAMARRAPGDIVLIAGKGHEQGQEFEGGRKLPFDDREVARDVLRGLRARSGARSVIRLTPGQIAHAAGGRLVAGSAEPAGVDDVPVRAVVDSREVAPGDLFVGLAGEHADGGRFAAEAIEHGAWGVDRRAAARRRRCGRGRAARRARGRGGGPARCARGGWRTRGCERLRGAGCRVVGITGSTGKTSTKDILSRCSRPRYGGRVHANRENFNTGDRAAADGARGQRRGCGCWCSRWRCAAWDRSASWRGSRTRTSA